MESRQKRNKILAARWGLYFFILLCGAALQSTPGFLAFGQVKPYFILGVCLAVAMHEGEFYGALFGMVGGLLWDYIAGRTVGMFGIGLMFVCWFASVLVQLYLKPGKTNFFLLNVGCGLLMTGVDFLFFHIMPGYPGARDAFLGVVVPEAVLSAVLAMLSVHLIHLVAGRFAPDGE